MEHYYLITMTNGYKHIIKSKIDIQNFISKIYNRENLEEKVLMLNLVDDGIIAIRAQYISSIEEIGH